MRMYASVPKETVLKRMFFYSQILFLLRFESICKSNHLSVYSSFCAKSNANLEYLTGLKTIEMNHGNGNEKERESGIEKQSSTAQNTSKERERA